MNSNNNQHISRLFEEQVTGRAGEPALQDHSRCMTYRELDEYACRLAGRLAGEQISPGDIVAVDTSSPIHMAAAILAVIKVGGVFMPFDPTFPIEYNRYQIRHSEAKFLLLHHRRKNLQDRFEIGHIVLLPETAQSFDAPGNNETAVSTVSCVEPDNPLAVFYSSHSSGTPQGVTLSHQCLSDWLAFNPERLHVDFSRTLFVASPHLKIDFPLWLVNLLSPSGGSVYFHEPRESQDPGELADIIRTHSITSVVCSLHYLRTLTDRGHLETVFSQNVSHVVTMGEDNFDPSALKAFLKKKEIKWFNYFGFPLFNMITTLVKQDLETDAGFKHMGKPGTGTMAYILNPAGREVPIGLPGELYVSGTGVIGRYHRNQRLNTAVFFHHPDNPGEKLFKTGYPAYWLPDGKLSLMDRERGPFNINGVRIALEEVETALSRHPSVKDFYVAAKKKNNEINRITVYLVQNEDSADDDLEGFLRNSLPPGYFPMGFVRLPALPRLSNGCVDTRYLEQIEYLDSRQVRSLEENIARLPQVGRAAVLVREKIEHPVPIHLKDVIPDSSTISKQKIEPPSENPEEPPESAVNRQKSAVDDPEPAIIHGAQLDWTGERPLTAIDTLTRAAERFGRNGITFIDTDGNVRFQDYSSLLQEARRVSSGLRKLGLEPGDNVLFQFDRDEDFVSAFWGCQLGGFIPVPLVLPKSFAGSSHEAQTMAHIWELLERPVILTRRRLEPAIRSLLEQARVEDIQPLRESGDDGLHYSGSPDDTAIILFTSGSTGLPKGVVQSQRAVFSFQNGFTAYKNGDHREVIVNWMPLEHVGGVIMSHIDAVYLGCRQIQVSTQYILTQPLRWLDIISTHRGTMTWAPNFAYALVNEQVEKNSALQWDLSSMKYFLNGGEAVNAGTGKRFLELLTPFGLAGDALKPIWGMSETSSGTIVSHTFTHAPHTGVHHLDKQALSSGLAKKSTSGTHIGTASFVELGCPIPGLSIRIADSANQVVNKGVIGRLQVKGPFVTSGYYKNPEQTAEVFTYDGWFDTGDLAFMSEGGMTITGRAKDIIIVNGINLNSVEIEAAVEELEGVETSFTAACAFREENSDTDRVAVFYHSRLTGIDQKVEQVTQIKKKILTRFGLGLDYVIPLAKEDIPKTSIGKIQRLKLAHSFQDGAYDSIVKQIDIHLENENTLPSWFFKTGWQNRPLRLFDVPFPDTLRTGSRRACLVFQDDTPLGGALAERLERENIPCIKVRSGNEFQVADSDRYHLDYREPNDYLRLFRELEKRNVQIDSLFFFDCNRRFSDHEREVEPRMMKDVHTRGIYSLVHLIRGLARDPGSSKRLFVVTANSRFIVTGDTVAAFEKGGVPGFLKSISLELDWLDCTHVDLDFNPGSPDSIGTIRTHAQSLLREWKNSAPVNDVAYRGGQRLLPFLEPVELKKHELLDIPVKPGGIYLVTGGLGGIGIHVCQWLMEKYRAKLILFGSTILPQRDRWETLLENKTAPYQRIQTYLHLDASRGDGEFIYESGDITDAAVLNRAVARAEAKWQDSLDGVFHLAGRGDLEHHWTQMEEHKVLNESIDTYETMFTPKVYGTLALHRLLKDRKDAVFVAFSSTVAYFGAASFSADSASNSFLDAYCRYRIAAGYSRTYCLNWSSWDDIGMSKNNPAPMANAMAANGYEIIQPVRGIHSLMLALRMPPQQILIGLNGSNNHIRSHMTQYPSPCQAITVYYSLNDTTDSSRQDIHSSIINTLQSVKSTGQRIVKTVRLDEIPLVDGKTVDYRQLRDLDRQPAGAGREWAPPLTDTQKKIASIWHNILDKTNIAADESFFELGGQSLNATVLASEIHKTFNVRMTLQDIFSAPTIKEMADFIQNATRDTYVSIQKAKEKDYYPLTTAQKRMYFNQQAGPQSIFYNITEAVEMEEELEKDKLEAVFRQLLNRHEALRTSFLVVEGEPVQKIRREVEMDLEYHDPVPPGEQEESPSRDTVATIIKNFVRPFDLTRAPLLRAGLIKLHEKRFILMVDIHHLIADEISWNLLIKNFVALYRGEELPPLKLQYKDYSEWQNNREQDSQIKKQEAFWLEQFEEEPPRWELPTDFERPRVMNFGGGNIQFPFDPAGIPDLQAILVREDVTLFMYTYAVYAIFLSLIGGQQDIVTGVPVSGRRHADLKEIIGYFVNTLPIRSFPHKEKTFVQFLREVRQHILEAFENQDYQFKELFEKMSAASRKTRSMNPLFNTMFSYISPTGQSQDSPQLETVKKWNYYDVDVLVTPVEFYFQAIGSAENLTFNLGYSSELFKKETIERFIEYFNEILDAVIQNEEIKLGDIRITHHLFDREVSIPETSFDFGVFEN